MTTHDDKARELLPCPFCGGECDPEGWLGGYKTTGPECSSCGATAENVEAWNRRAALSPASTGQEAMQDALTDAMTHGIGVVRIDPANLFAAPAQQVEAEIREAAEAMLEVLDGYPEQLVPINRQSATVTRLRKALKSAAGSNNGEKG